MSADLVAFKYNRDALKGMKQRFPGVEEATLIRFLFSCKSDLTETARKFQRYENWRESNFPITTASIYNELRTGKVYVQGFDKLGHPLIIFRPYCSNIKTRSLEEMVRLMLFMSEIAIQQLPEDRLMFSVLVDRSSASQPDFEMLRSISDLIDKYYPGRLFRVYFHPCSYVLKGLWQLAKNVAPRGANEKFRPKASLAALRAVIPNEHIPAVMGGACHYKFSEEDFPSPFLNESYYAAGVAVANMGNGHRVDVGQKQHDHDHDYGRDRTMGVDAREGRSRSRGRGNSDDSNNNNNNNSSNSNNSNRPRGLPLRDRQICHDHSGSEDELDYHAVVPSSRSGGSSDWKSAGNSPISAGSRGSYR